MVNILDKAETTTRIRKIKLEKDNLHFQFISNGVLQNEVTLKAGFEYITKTYFLHDIPTVPEVELASNYFEYDLTDQKIVVNNNELLTCSNEILTDLLGVKSKIIFTRDQIEEFFNKYTDYVEGEPMHALQIEFTKEKLSVILLIRHIMYYLNFTQIEVG